MAPGQRPVWRWVALEVIHAVHDRQIAEHGGAAGVRDAGLIESAMARPAMIANYGAPNAADLAAAYAFGLARNHGFVDGNKRTAWVAARIFLRLNGCALAFEPGDAVRVMERVASGAMDEAALTAWFRVGI